MCANWNRIPSLSSWLIVECQWVLGVYVLQQQQEQQLNVCDVSVGGSSHVDNVGNFVMKSC